MPAIMRGFGWKTSKHSQYPWKNNAEFDRDQTFAPPAGWPSQPQTPKLFGGRNGRAF
jgi:hypothetical protein